MAEGLMPGQWRLGIDEAGRGCVLGPLVICGFAVERENLPLLELLSLKDSKALSPAKRERLAVELRNIPGRIFLMKVRPSIVDAAVSRQGLNTLEIAGMVRLIRRINPGSVFIDALTSNPGRFGDQISGLIAPLTTKVVAENRADSKFPIVMAASILAKVARDAVIAGLRRRYGDIGSGYPGDPKTRKFLGGYSISGDYPHCVRRSWSTLENIRRQALNPVEA